MTIHSNPASMSLPPVSSKARNPVPVSSQRHLDALDQMFGYYAA